MLLARSVELARRFEERLFAPDRRCGRPPSVGVLVLYGLLTRADDFD